jgi:hypothetical protein
MSKFVKVKPPAWKPAKVKFKDGCRLKWAGEYSENTVVVRVGGKWWYVSVSKGDEAEGIFAGTPTLSDDEVYMVEYLDGLWVEV